MDMGNRRVGVPYGTTISTSSVCISLARYTTKLFTFSLSRVKRTTCVKDAASIVTFNGGHLEAQQDVVLQPAHCNRGRGTSYR